MLRIRNLVALLVVMCLSVSFAAAKTSPLTNALFLVTDNEHHTEVAIQPIDPVTLQDIPDMTPISLGQHYVAEMSADRTLLAVVVWPNSADDGGMLHLINLTNWSDQTTNATYDTYVDALYFSPDNTTIYSIQGVAPRQTFEVPEPPEHYQIIGYSIGSTMTSVLIDLPKNFVPYSQRLLKSGSQMAVFGVVTTGFIAKAAPDVILADLSTKQITATIKLDGLEAGTKPLNNNMPYELAYENNQPGLAWNLDANQLYVAHATGNEITVVDLAQGTTREIAYQTSKAAVKSKGIMPGEDRIAIFNPTSGDLLVSSNHREAHSLDNNEYDSTMQPMGIQAIGLRDRQAQRVDLPVYQMMLSPNGKTILATGTEMDAASTGDWKTTYSGLYILDADSLQTLKQIKADNTMLTLDGFSTDSQTAYTSSYDPNTMYPATTLRAIDLTTLEVKVERTLPAGTSDLIGTVNGYTP